MPLKSSCITQVIGRMLLWAMPAFLLWWLLLGTVFNPMLSLISGALLSSSFEQVQPKVMSAEDGSWYINTRALLPSSNIAAKKLQALNVRIPKNMQLSFGLPLLWALLLAIPYQRTRNLLIGSGIIFSLAIFVCWLLLSKYLLFGIASTGAQQVYVGAGIIQELNAFPAWLGEALSWIYPFCAYSNLFFVPLLLAYVLTQTWWKDCLDSNPQLADPALTQD